MADPSQPPVTDGPQSKAALNYRMGGDHCAVCAYYGGVPNEAGKGTCPRVTPPDVDAGDLCDDFKRAGREHAQPEGAAQKTALPGEPGVVENLQRRGMISDKAMSKMPGGSAGRAY